MSYRVSQPPSIDRCHPETIGRTKGIYRLGRLVQEEGYAIVGHASCLEGMAIHEVSFVSR
jgi:hypothetical protein